MPASVTTTADTRNRAVLNYRWHDGLHTRRFKRRKLADETAAQRNEQGQGWLLLSNYHTSRWCDLLSIFFSAFFSLARPEFLTTASAPRHAKHQACVKALEEIFDMSISDIAEGMQHGSAQAEKAAHTNTSPTAILNEVRLSVSRVDCIAAPVAGDTKARAQGEDRVRRTFNWTRQALLPGVLHGPSFRSM